MGNPSHIFHIQLHATSVKRTLLGAALLSSLSRSVEALLSVSRTSVAGVVNHTIANETMLADDALAISTLADIQAHVANRSAVGTSQGTHFDDHNSTMRWIAPWVRRAKRVLRIAAAKRDNRTFTSETMRARRVLKRRGNLRKNDGDGPEYGGPWPRQAQDDLYVNDRYVQDDDFAYENVKSEAEDELENELGSVRDYDDKKDPDAMNGYDSDDVQQSSEEDPLDDDTKAAIKKEVEEELRFYSDDVQQPNDEDPVDDDTKPAIKKEVEEEL